MKDTLFSEAASKNVFYLEGSCGKCVTMLISVNYAGVYCIMMICTVSQFSTACTCMFACINSNVKRAPGR